MKATILHESRGRIRVRINKEKMSLSEADLLQEWFEKKSWIAEATVHERTRCMILRYKTDRKTVISEISNFTWENAKTALPEITHSTRELNREFEEKLVGKIFWKITGSLFFPEPLRMLKMIRHMCPFMKRGLHCLIHRQMKVELLDSLSIGVSACRKDFRTSSAVMFLLEIGELLEDWTRKRSVEDLARCMSLNVDRVWVKTPEGSEMLTPVSSVCPGDHIIVRMGGIIPVDGMILDGEVTVNQASLTGESIPLPKRPGSSLYAGTVIEEGECILEVKKVSGESRYDQIVSMIENSQQLKSATESRASSLADKLVPYTFAGSLLSFVLTRNMTKVLSVLMVDFSCALKLAMPLAVLSAMQEAGKEHITVKGGKFLEAVAQADTIVFDKTGTLTHACPKVEIVVPFNGYEESEMLRLAACLEEHFPHSLANAVVEKAKELGLSHEEFHTKVNYQVAHGISSTVNDKQVQIGSAHFIFEDEHCIISENDQEKFDALPSEYTHLYLAIAGKLAAVICIFDPLRQEASSVLCALRELGITQRIMLTGDSHRTACAVAAQVGVDQFQAEVLPADKAQIIADLRAKGHTVIMVGDGINDSPALSESDAGIAISDGAAIAREIADITISAENLWELVTLRQISMGLMKRIHSNYRFVIGFNGGLITLGMLGLMTPALSATLHNLSTLVISLKSMTTLKKPQISHNPADMES